MKKITRRIPARTVTRYQCEVCGEKYRTAMAAKKCEAIPAETKFAKVRDKILFPQDSHLCWYGVRTKPIIGRVVKISFNPYLKKHQLEYRIKYLCSKNGCGCQRLRDVGRDSLTAEELKRIGATIVK